MFSPREKFTPMKFMFAAVAYATRSAHKCVRHTCRLYH